jgi:hypothetical protein
MAVKLFSNSFFLVFNKLSVCFSLIERKLVTLNSKRIENNATYIKTQHAPIILQEIGLPKIRGKCQGFDTWLTQLENLSK